MSDVEHQHNTCHCPNQDVRIICVGNALHGDDAAGYRVFELLKQFRWPPGVSLVDGGTGGVALVPHFRDCRKVIVIDVFNASDQADQADQAGQIVHVEGVTVDSLGSDESNCAFEHGGGLKELLAILPLYISPLPVIDFVGIGGIDFSAYRATLSPEVAQALPPLCQWLHQRVSDESVR